MQILHAFARLEIDAGSHSAGDGGEQAGHIVPQQLPLLAVDPGASVVGLRALDAREDGAHALRMRVRQALQHERIHNGEDGRIRADGKRQRKNHCGGKTRIAQQLPHGKLEILPEYAHRSTSFPSAHFKN